MTTFVLINLFIHVTNLTENLLFTRLWEFMSEENMGPNFETLTMYKERQICTAKV